jgi:putative DNA primase/helicase
MGYSLYRGYPLKNYTVLDGGGDNGKTVLMNVMLALAGEQNNTSIGLQELNERPFAKAQLYGKNTNISDDLPKKALKLTGIIKAITGNSPIWADVKNSKKGISFTPYAKPWYACNELPETSDYSDAFFSRQLQVTLLNKYLSKEDPKIDNKTCFERNVHLTEELTTPESLSGILNFALMGLKRVLEKNVFSDDTTTDDKRNQWIRKTNPIAAFLDDEFEIGDNDWCITVEDFYNEIIHFCEKHEFDKPTSRKYVTEKVLDANLGIKKLQKKIDGVPHTWCWVGLSCTSNTLINRFIGEKPKQKEPQKELVI